MAREIHLPSDLWANLPESVGRWYDYNRSEEEGPGREAVLRQVVPRLLEIIAADLTDRQREVMKLYYAPEAATQACIGRTLGISQATVNQHLHGKRRNGKRIGGAVGRIRKGIRRRACSDNDVKALSILDRLLTQRANRRRASDLLDLLVD